MTKTEVFYEFNEELESLWRDFESEAHFLPFQSYEWQRYWNTEVGQPKYKMEIYIVVCLVNDRVRAIFPFGIKRALGARILEFFGGDQADYSAPLLGTSMDSEEFKLIWIEVLSVIPRHDVVYFKNIPKLINQSDNFLVDNISTRHTDFSYSTILPNSFEDYSLRLSKSMQKDNKRMVRRLSELGELKFVIIETPEDFNEIVEVMIAQKESRYALSGAKNIFYDEPVRKFYSNLFTLLRKGFGVHLSTLMLDHEILATHLGIRHQDQFYYLMPTFNHDDKWRKFSLGRIHLEKLVDWAIGNGINKFDFTIGGESYKTIWCDEEMAIYRHLKIRSFRGAIYYAFFLVLELIKSKTFLKKLTLKILSLYQKLQNR